MRYHQLIDDTTFIKDKNEFTAKIAQLKNKLRETEAGAERWLELSERTFSFATYARKAFITGTLELKKKILLALDQVPEIKDGRVMNDSNEGLC